MFPDGLPRSLLPPPATRRPRSVRRAAEAIAKALEAAERGIDQTTSAFFAWAAKYDIDVQDREGGPLRVEFGAVDDLRRKLREGYDLWTAADMPPERYHMAKVRYKEEVESDLNYLDTTETNSFVAEAWRLLE